jgi:hypothetical protein
LRGLHQLPFDDNVSASDVRSCWSSSPASSIVAVFLAVWNEYLFFQHESGDKWSVNTGFMETRKIYAPPPALPTCLP